MNEEYLYDEKLLKNLNFEATKNVLNSSISVSQPGEGLIIRPLSVADFERGKIQVFLLLLFSYKNKHFFSN